MPKNAVEHWVAERNIVQFQKQIAAERDEAMRRILEGLLEREKLKLKAMTNPHWR